MKADAMSAIECFAAAHALAHEKERRYDECVDELARVQLRAMDLRDHYVSLLHLATAAARRVIDSGEISEKEFERRAERLEYEAGIAKIRAARLAREAAAQMKAAA